MAKTKTREIGPSSFRAAVVPGSFNEEKRTVDVVWSTGARVLREFFFSEPFFEELSMKPKHVRMERLKSGNTPVLNTHRSSDLSDVLGVVEKASLAKGEGKATLRFSHEEDVDRVFRMIGEGIITNVSVGYRTFKSEEVPTKEGETRIFRAIDWEPHELSMVPIGADAGASVRNEAQNNNPCEFIFANDQEQRAMADDDKTPVATPAAPQPVAPSAPVVPAPAAITAAPEPTPEQTRAIQVADRQRTSAIQQCARTLGVSDEVAQAAVDKGTSLDAFRAASVEDFEQRNQTVIPDTARPDIEGGDDAKDKMTRGLTAWLITRSGKRDDVLAMAKKRGETLDLDPGEFRGMTLLDICRESLKSNGQQYRGLSKMGLAGAALTFRHETVGFAVTTDFPNLLENVMHKLLLGSYAITPDTWTRFCATGSVSDFRLHNRYRQGSFGKLDKVDEAGEFKNKSIPDARKETIAAETFGNIIMLSRQAIINDDMDAFAKLATQLGRAAKLSVEIDVYATLAENGGFGPLLGDGLPIFDAAHANIGAATALTVAGVDIDRVVMKSQKDESSNDILDLTPMTLLVAAGLGATARQVNESQFDIDDIGGHAANTSRGLYSDIVDTARLTGTRRYSFADVAVAPVLEVAFLDGQQEPFLEMQEGFRVDGVSWKVRSDYGVSGIDFKGAVTNAG